jgi:hypothetical protein
MDRRAFNAMTLPLFMAHQRAFALGIGDLTNAEASQGLKTALERGALVAVSLLGKPDGFLGNDKVRIPLPGYLEKVSGALKMMGQGSRMDELLTAMNRAAEAAVPMSKDLLIGAVRSMSVGDAKKILSGGDTSITDFFAEKTRDPLGVKFLPVVNRATKSVQLAQKYNKVAAKAAGLGLIKSEDANIDKYVTDKSLDGLYWMIGEEERKIRQDPIGTGSALLQKVFGALR